MLLQEIIEHKKEEIRLRKKQFSLAFLEEEISLREHYACFETALRKEGKRLKLIAEIKKASPTRGVIKKRFNPLDIAKSYEEYGADCLSVLTDGRYFHGDIDHLQQIRSFVGLPILRKDFIIEEYQIKESAACGADAILLIASILSQEKIDKFLKLSENLKMTALVETHTEEEMKKVLKTKARIIGINNRNLDTLEVNLDVTEKLIKMVPDDRIVVSESGIRTATEVEWLEAIGVKAILVGESLLISKNLKEKMEELLSVNRRKTRATG